MRLRFCADCGRNHYSQGWPEQPASRRAGIINLALIVGQVVLMLIIIGGIAWTTGAGA